MKRKITSGNRFGRLIAVSRIDAKRWIFKCDCGTEKTIGLKQVYCGDTQSCGCLRREVTGYSFRKHGATASRAYNTWSHIVQRCTNPSHPKWRWYGGRGISVCERWMSASNFIEDMGQPPPKHSIDRIDCNGNYEPSNCRWATQKQQVRNTRRTKFFELHGIKKSMPDWAEDTGVPYSLLRDRLGRGWSFERALLTPKKCSS